MNIEGINNNINSNTINNAKSSVSDSRFEEKLKSAFDKKDEKALKEACNQFEAIFLNIVYKQMKSTVNKSQLIPSDAGKEIFDNMLDEKLMDQAAERNSFGIGNMLFKQLSKQMKNAYKPESST